MLLLLAAAAVAVPPAAPVLHKFSEVALSSAGDRIAAVENELRADSAAPEGHGAVVVRDRRGAVVARFDPCPACGYGGAAWSASGALAFVATDPAAHAATLMVAEGGAVQTVATVRGVAQTPRWSPDGTAIALLAVEGATKSTGAVEAGAPQVGEIGETTDEQRIAVVPATGGALRFVSPADTYVYEYDWRPDGQGFVATAAKGNGDNNWWVAKLVAIERADGATRTIAAPPVQINMPRVSPDGTTVAFIGGLMSDFGSVGGDLFTVPLTGGMPRNLTAGAKTTIRSVVWAGADPVVTRLAGANAQIARVRASDGATTLLWSGAVTPTAGDGEVAINRDATQFAAAVEDFEHPVELAAGTLQGATLKLTPVTRVNTAIVPPARATSVTWTNDGFDLQGWLLAPRKGGAGKQVPAGGAGKQAPAGGAGKQAMVVIPHGGPSAAVTPEFPWNDTVRLLLDHGYYVFQPNPRGSYGQGEAFTAANVKDFGGGDLRDIMAGIDAVERVAPVDDARLGMFGHSYGGYMTMWAVTHTTRFKGAVVGAGIANWISYYGQNGIDQWMPPFFGASAYDDPAPYVRASPLTTIKAAKTPTFIYVGERDLECPPAQSVEFWHALKEFGVETSLVIYAGEGHHLRRADSVHDRETRTVGWFDAHLK